MINSLNTRGYENTKGYINGELYLGKLPYGYDATVRLSGDIITFKTYCRWSFCNSFVPEIYLSEQGLVFMNSHKIPLYVYDGHSCLGYYKTYYNEDGEPYENNKYDGEPILRPEELLPLINKLKVKHIMMEELRK